MDYQESPINGENWGTGSWNDLLKDTDGKGGTHVFQSRGHCSVHGTIVVSVARYKGYEYLLHTSIDVSMCKVMYIYIHIYMCLQICAMCTYYIFPYLFQVPNNMDVPRLGVESELQLQTHATALQQCWILNPLSEVRDRTCILTDIMLGS